MKLLRESFSYTCENKCKILKTCGNETPPPLASSRGADFADQKAGLFCPWQSLQETLSYYIK